ncbi:unnamed protein product, partial [Mesorhabditis spiculigera]
MQNWVGIAISAHVAIYSVTMTFIYIFANRNVRTLSIKLVKQQIKETCVTTVIEVIFLILTCLAYLPFFYVVCTCPIFHINLRRIIFVTVLHTFLTMVMRFIMMLYEFEVVTRTGVLLIRDVFMFVGVPLCLGGIFGFVLTYRLVARQNSITLSNLEIGSSSYGLSAKYQAAENIKCFKLVRYFLLLSICADFFGASLVMISVLGSKTPTLETLIAGAIFEHWVTV